MGISLFTGSNVKTTSVVDNHFILTGHKISFDNFIVLRSAPNRQSLLIYQLLLIKSPKPNLNTQLNLSNLRLSISFSCYYSCLFL